MAVKKIWLKSCKKSFWEGFEKTESLGKQALVRSFRKQNKRVAIIPEI
jgi:hypothetical protein